MTDFLVIGSLPVLVATEDAELSDREEIGDTGRAWDGTFRSTVVAHKDKWTCSTPYLTVAEVDAIDTAIGLGSVNVSGGLFGTLGATPFAAHVVVTHRKPFYDKSQASGAKWILDLEITQV